MYIRHGRLFVCLTFCIPTLLHGPGCKLGNGRGCLQVLRSPIKAALLHGTQAVGISQTLQHGTKKGITELSLLVCAFCMSEGGHHVGHGHRPTF